MAAFSLFRGTNMAVVTSCENQEIGASNDRHFISVLIITTFRYGKKKLMNSASAFLPNERKVICTI